MKKIIPLFLLIVFLIIPQTIFASPLGVALSLPISDRNGPILNGSLISSSQNGFELSKVDYDPAFYGVVTTVPAMVLEERTETLGVYPVVTTGTVSVRVTTKNGQIRTGDNITTSSTPGVGLKADNEGYIVGTALGSCALDSNQECLILVSIAPRFAPGTTSGFKGINLLTNVKKAASSPFLSPLTSLRYLLAVTVTAVAFGFGFYFFGRSGKTGLEALGRNPLAARKIGLGMLINFLFTAMIISFGLLIAYMVLVL